MPGKVVITDYEYPNIDSERRIVARAGYELADYQVRTEAELMDVTRDADVVITQYAHVNRRVIENMTRCKAVVKYGIGVNNIDADAACERGIYVCNVPDYGLDEVSNHAIAMLLALARKLPLADRGLRAGDWGTAALKPIARLSECTLGLVGFGALGKLVGRKMAAFGVEIAVFDPFLDHAAARDLGVKALPIDELCRRSDFISVHCPLTPETRHLFNRERLKLMKPTAYLVNTSRGPVVDERALAEALRTGVIAGAGLDVYEMEPLPADSELRSLDNAILTSHIAWYSEQAIDILQIKAAEEAVNILRGNKPFNACNKFNQSSLLEKIPHETPPHHS